MGSTDDKFKRQKYLVLSIVSNLALLFIFKYFNFFNQSVAQVAAIFHFSYNAPISHLLLPIGISFHTFQSMSYAIDVYRGTVQRERNFIRFATYIAFFPQLVAGPIERAKHLLAQFYEEHHFNYTDLKDGLTLMLWGYFQKIVIADHLAVYVNEMYNNVPNHNGPHLVIATYFFAFQIFCDFAGYSNIAIGAAKVMGFRLMDNFNRPYFARSIPEFWRRWHISLMTWFKDYIYIPLGGNRVLKWRWYYNIFIVFLISGLWHGAQWTFICWGLLHGIYMIVSLFTKNIRQRFAEWLGIAQSSWYGIFQTFITFNLVSFAWIFFRANSIEDVGLILHKIFFSFRGFNDAVPLVHAKYLLAIIFIMEIIHLFQCKYSLRQMLAIQPAFVRWGIYYLAFFAIILFL